MIGFTAFVVALGVSLFAGVVLRCGWLKSVAATSMVLLLVFWWRRMSLVFGPLGLDVNTFWGSLAPLVFLVPLTVVGIRAAESKEFRSIFLAITIGIAGTASVQLIRDAVALRPGAIRTFGGPLVLDSKNHDPPDIYYLVLDGYGRGDVLRDLYGFDNSPFVRELERRGFDVPSKASANYSMTYASVSATLAMDYPIGTGRAIDERTRIALYDVMGGSSPVVSALKHAGYEIVHLEGGFGGTRCGPPVDRCIRAPFLEEGSWEMIDRSPLRLPFRARYGHAFTVDSMDRLQRLTEVARDRPRRPRFIFGHILIPHPPLHVGADCSVNTDQRLEGLNVVVPWNQEDAPRRRAAYVDQIRCLNRRLLQVIDTARPRSVVFLSGDHGPDSLFQLFTRTENWDASQRRERFAIMSAYRLPAGCRGTIADGATPVNAFRKIFGCVFEVRLPALPDRFFIVPVDDVGGPDRTLELSEPPS